jgi:hypothetical protein
MMDSALTRVLSRVTINEELPQGMPQPVSVQIGGT